MNEEKYLRRIGIKDKKIAINLENLKFLQRQHLLNVPFENLDIHWKRPIILNEESFYQKIVEQKRGGFCYELNGLFAKLLNEIGLQSKLISARVAKNEGEFGAEKDHMAILTYIEGEKYLVDVGFGSFIAEPLELILDVEQQDATGTYLIKRRADDYFSVAKKDGEKWKDVFIFKSENYDLKDFSEMCNFHQTSPESHFTRNRVCSLMTAKGRKNLTDKKFIETSNGEKIEKTVESEKEFNFILDREFNIKNDVQ